MFLGMGQIVSIEDEGRDSLSSTATVYERSFDDGSNFDAELGLEREACIAASTALQQETFEVRPLRVLQPSKTKNLSAVSPASATAALMQGTEGHQRDPIAPWRQSLVLAEARVEDEILGYKNGRDSGEKVSSGWTVLPTDEMFVQRCLWVLERSHAIAAGN